MVCAGDGETMERGNEFMIDCEKKHGNQVVKNRLRQSHR